MKLFGLLFTLIATSTIAYGQQRTIYGTVTSAMDGNPVSGVMIVLLEEKIDIKRNQITFTETKIKTRTNEKGKYKLTVPDTGNNVIRFKKRPYSTTDVNLDNRTELDLSIALPMMQDK